MELRRDKEKILVELEKVIEEAIRKIKNKKIALLFSGGIDSTMIAYFLKKLNCDFICYTIGFKNSEDLLFAKKVADKLELPLKVGTIDEGQLEDLIKEIIRLDIKDVIDIEVSIPMYVAGMLAKEDNREILISGLGSDEVLAGYGSHKKALEKNYGEVHRECIRRIENIFKDVKRDEKIAEKFGLKIYFPFLDKDFVKLALTISPELKISKESEKIILRELGKKLRIPEIVINRKKRAAQYGSGAHKALKKLAKRKGFNYIADYLKTLIKN